MRIKQLIPADGWHVLRRDFGSTGMRDSERVWHHPLCAFALIEDEDGSTYVDGVEVCGNHIEPAGYESSPGEYLEFVCAEELEAAIDKHYEIWRTKPWERTA